jgi:hypothetical protein
LARLLNSLSIVADLVSFVRNEVPRLKRLGRGLARNALWADDPWPELQPKTGAAKGTDLDVH